MFKPSESIKSPLDYYVKWPFPVTKGLPFYFSSFLVINVHYVVTVFPFYEYVTRVDVWSPGPISTIPINNGLTSFTLKSVYILPLSLAFVFQTIKSSALSL